MFAGGELQRSSMAPPTCARGPPVARPEGHEERANRKAHLKMATARSAPRAAQRVGLELFWNPPKRSGRQSAQPEDSRNDRGPDLRPSLNVARKWRGGRDSNQPLPHDARESSEKGEVDASDTHRATEASSAGDGRDCLTAGDLDARREDLWLALRQAVDRGDADVASTTLAGLLTDGQEPLAIVAGGVVLRH